MGGPRGGSDVWQTQGLETPVFGSVAMIGLTGEFSDVWQGKDLEDTELGRVRNRLKTKNGIGGFLCMIRLQESTWDGRKDIEGVRRTAWRVRMVRRALRNRAKST
jgi:hypothetical protein